MDTESQIGDILARYWLVENRYCGLAESQVLKRLNQLTSNPLTTDELHSRLLTMQARGEVVIGRPETDPIVFPRRPLLEPRDPVKENEVGIYAKQLRLGGSQIALRYFDRQVLDRYRQDPRYEFKELAVSGRISTPSNVPNMLLKDRVYIRFGRACHPNGTPAVATILFDLGELPKQHQQYWASYEIHEDCQPDADFIKQNFDAEPIQRISPPDALLSELQEINRICKLTGEPELFRETYESHKLSRLGLITKPTAYEFRSFVNELDKLLSQNINKEFFKNKLALVDTKGVDKGTLMLLDEYLKSYGLTSSEVSEICKPLGHVRNCRQIPAHKITEDEFDTDYWVQQNNLIIDVLKAIHLLRKVFEKHPSLKHKMYVPPKWLNGWRIK
jgi:hypothetical protein